MSLASQAGTAAGTVAAAGAAVSLWLGAARYAGPLRRAYRWFAIAAALWGVGVITAQLLAAPAAAAAIQKRSPSNVRSSRSARYPRLSYRRN